MSDTMGSTIRYVFEGDAASIIEAFNQTAEAAQAAVDRISGQAQEATDSLEGTGGAVEGLSEKFAQAGEAASGLGEKLDTIGEGAGASVEGLQAKFDGLDSSIAGVDEKLGTIADTSEEVGDKVDESSGVMSAALGRIGAVLEGLEGKFGIVGEAAARMGEQISAAADTSDAELESTAGAADGLSASLASVGKGTVIGLAVAAAGALDLADKMDQATGAIAANAGISTAAASKIGAAFDSTAGQFIVSGKDMAAAYAPVAAQLGAVQGHALSAAQALLIEKDAAFAAEATGGSLASTTSTLAAAMQAYQIPISQATTATNALYVAGKVTGSGFDAVGTQLDKMKAKLGALAPPLDQSAALLADLTEHGETGRVAMSSLTTAVTGLEKPTLALTQAQQTQRSLLSQMSPSLRSLAEGYESGKVSSQSYLTATEGLSGAQAAIATKFGGTVTAITNAKDAIKQSGIAVENSKGQFLGLGTIIDELHRQIAGMSTTQALATLTQDGLGSSAAKLLPTIEAGSAAFNAASAAVDKNNTVQTAAQKATQNLHDQFEKAKSAIDDVFTEIGEKLMPVVERMIAGFASATSFVVQHKAVMIALAVVVGGVLTAAIIAYTASMVAAAAATIAAAAPILAVVAAAALLVAAGYEVYKHWGQIWPEIKRITVDAWDAIKTAFDDVWHFIEHWGPLVVEAILVPFTGGMSLILPMVIKHWSDIESFFKKIPGEIEGFFAAAANWLIKAGEDVLSGLIHGIEDIFHSYFRVFWVDLPRTIIAWIGDAGEWLFEIGEDIIRGLVNGVKGAIGTVKSVLGDVASTVKSAFSSVLGIFSPSTVFAEYGRNIMEGLAQGVNAHAHVAQAAVTAAAKGLNPALQSGLGTFTVPPTAGAAGSLAGGSSGGGPVTVNLILNGQKLGEVMLPTLVTLLQQASRTQNLGF